MSRNKVYIVSYDISNPHRLRNIARIMEGYGRRLQNSVFETHLNDFRYEKLKSQIQKELNHEDDQVLFISLGPESGDANVRVESIGRPYCGKTRITII